VGVVTADADGQHHPEDIQRVAAILAEDRESLTLGVRALDADVPLRGDIIHAAGVRGAIPSSAPKARIGALSAECYRVDPARASLWRR